MVIIFEGIDKVGKTTLANKVSKELGFTIFKKDRIGGNNDIGEYSEVMNYGNAIGLVDMWNWDGFNQNIIVDRFHWTEAVYGKIERRSHRVERYMENVEQLMNTKPCKYLMVFVLPVDIKYSIRIHGADLQEHQKMFEELYKKSTLNKYRCTIYSGGLLVYHIKTIMGIGD